MRRLVFAVVLSLAAAVAAQAQALGPQRQFLAIEPYYERTQLDVGSSIAKDGLNGYGARLWINLDPFHFILNSSIALYASHAPAESGNGESMTTYGAEYDQYFVRRPLGGLVDPFLVVGGGGVRIRSEQSTLFASVPGQTSSYGSVFGGGGLRLALPNRFELRGDAKDLVIFGTPTGSAGTNRTTNNLVIEAGLGITF